jgi:hypothetical protein
VLYLPFRDTISSKSLHQAVIREKLFLAVNDNHKSVTKLHSSDIMHSSLEYDRKKFLCHKIGKSIILVKRYHGIHN